MVVFQFWWIGTVACRQQVVSRTEPHHLRKVCDDPLTPDTREKQDKVEGCKGIVQCDGDGDSGRGRLRERGGS